MTVQQAIQLLLNIDNKDKELCFSRQFGEQENGDTLDLNEIIEYDDCVMLTD